MLMLILTTLTFAQSQTPITDCDLAYESRPLNISQTTDCYFNVTEPDQRQRALEMSALAASWNAIRSPDINVRAAAIIQGERAADELMRTFEKAGSGYYWSAIFLSQKAKDKDGNALIPTATLKALPKIKSKLRKTIELDETVHGYGAHRVLGIIYTTVPGLVGGDKELGEKYFKTALEKAPHFSINPLYYGKFLIADDRKSEAEQVMKELISMDPAAFDSSRIPESTLDQKEAKDDLK